MDDLRPLLAFAAVLEHGSMNAAAQALGMSPSAVSQHISRLEKLHGVKLLHRSTRHLAPTDAGSALGEHCRRLLASVQDVRLTLTNLKTNIAGEVRLAAPTGMADAAAFQQAVVDTLVIKSRRAWQETGYRDLVVAGGVSANRALRHALQQEAEKRGKRVYFPPLALCGDNALMIAYAAAQRYDGHDSPLNITVKARWDLTDLPPHPIRQP